MMTYHECEEAIGDMQVEHSALGILISDHVEAVGVLCLASNAWKIVVVRTEN